MTHQEILENSNFLLMAGSETTATALSGMTYYLLKHPPILEKLQSEVRSAFKREENITLETVGEPGRLPYMEAVMTESLRLYPPVPALLPRLTGPEGEIIDGKFVPPNVG